MQSRKKIVDAFAKALRRFNGDTVLCKEKDESVVLRDAISLVVQPRRQGSKARDETANLIEKVGWTKK